MSYFTPLCFYKKRDTPDYVLWHLLKTTRSQTFTFWNFLIRVLISKYIPFVPNNHHQFVWQWDGGEDMYSFLLFCTALLDAFNS